jgi:hypothetical protein
MNHAQLQHQRMLQRQLELRESNARRLMAEVCCDVQKTLERVASLKERLSDAVTRQRHSALDGERGLSADDGRIAEELHRQSLRLEELHAALDRLGEDYEQARQGRRAAELVVQRIQRRLGRRTSARTAAEHGRLAEIHNLRRQTA